MLSPPIPDWLRILAWGLLASFLFHWMAFDLMRTAAWVPHMASAPALQVRLRPDDLRMAQALAKTAPAIRPTQGAERKGARAAVEPAPARSGVLRQPVPAQPVALATEAAPVVIMPIEGLRSGRPEEALVALRLALASALAPQSLSFSKTSQGVLLWCDFDATGHLLDVRSDVVSQPALLMSVKRAASRVDVPDGLVGRAFSLELLFEAD